MKAHWHCGVALAAVLGLGGAAEAQVGAPTGGPVGRDSIGGIVRPGDTSATTYGRIGATDAGASRLGAGAGTSRMGAVQPGGAPGSGGRAAGAGPGAAQGDLGISDPFAAAGSGVGGPSADDRAAGSVNDALANLPTASPDAAAPGGAPGPELDNRGPLDPINPLGAPTPGGLALPPGIGTGLPGQSPY